MRSDELLRVAAVGTGGIFIGAHMKCYPGIKSAMLVGFYDINRRRAEYAAKRYEILVKESLQKAESLEDKERLERTLREIRVYSSLDELLDDAQIDIVDVCTPPRWHDEIAIAALSKGRNVMVEKPMARTWIESQEVVKVAKESSALYQHNENFVYSGPIITVKKLLDSGVIGEILSIKVCVEHDGPEWSSWFWDPLIGGGGCLVDMAPHSITTIWFLAGFDKRPVAVRSCGIRINFPLRYIDGMIRRISVDDYANIKILLKDPESGDIILGNSLSGWSASRYIRGSFVSVEGSEGTISLAYEDRQAVITLRTRTGGERKLTPPKDNSFLNEIRNFVECVKAKRRSLTDEVVGSETMAIIGAAYLSELRGRRIVEIDEFKEYANNFLAKERDYKRAADKLITSLLKPYNQSS